MGNPLEDYYASQSDYLNQLKQQTQPQTGLAGLDPVWLAAAQGFLSPTKTGGFGESIANAAGAVQAPLKAIKDQQMSAADKIRAAQEATAKMYLLQQQRADAQAHNEAGNVGMEELRAAQAKYYLSAAANKDDAALLKEYDSVTRALNAMPKGIALSTSGLAPDDIRKMEDHRLYLQERQKEIDEALKKRRSGNIEDSSSSAAPSTPQPPAGAKIGIDPKTGEQGYYIKQGDKMMKWQP